MCGSTVFLKTELFFLVRAVSFFFSKKSNL
jgi:hypothetical protein